MAYDAGLKVGVEGESQFKAAIKNINANIKSLNAALKSSDAAFKGNEKSEQALTQKSKLLQQAIQATKQKVQALATQYEKSAQKTQQLKQNMEAAKAEFGENSRQAQQAEIAYNRQAAATQTLAAQHTQAAASLQQLETELADVERESSSAAQAERRAAEAAEELARQQQEAADKVAATSEQLGKGAQAMQAVNQAALAVAAAIGAVTVAATKVGMDFEAQMSKVTAISGATEEEFSALSAKAKEMGATTKFSATESGQALEYMAMASWKSEQMIAGLPGIMNLAAAAGEDLGTTSDIVTDALTAFNMTADQSGHFADVIAAASSNANTNVSLLGESFKYVGTQAGALGYSAEDVSLALGLMANAGLKGSMSGTALSTTLTRLATNTKGARDAVEELGVQFYNEDGTASDLNSVLKGLRKATANLTAEQKSNIAKTVAGQEAQKGLLAILNAQESDYKKLESAIYNADGAAKRMADTMNDNLKGQLTLMGSALEGAGIAFYEKFQEPLTDAVRIASDKISQFTTMLDSGQLDNTMNGIATAAAGVTAAIVAMNGVLVVKDILNFGAAFKATGAQLAGYTATTKAGALATGALNLAMSLGPVGLFAAAIAGVSAALIAYGAATNKAETETAKLIEANNEYHKQHKEWIKQQDTMVEARDKNIAASEREARSTESYINSLRKIIDENGKVKDGYEERAAFLAEQINSVIPNAISMNENEAGSNVAIADGIETMLAAKRKESTLAAYQEQYSDALQNSFDAQMKLIDSSKKLSDAHAKLVNANNDLITAQKNYDDEAAKNADIVSEKTQQALNDATYAVQDAQNEYNSLSQTVSDARAEFESYQNTIENVSALELAQTPAEIDSAISAINVSMSELTNVTGKTADEIKANYDTAMEAVRQSVQKLNDPTLAEAQRIPWEKAARNAQEGAETLIQEYEKAGGKVTSTMVESLNASKESVRAATEGTGRFAADGWAAGLASGGKDAEVQAAEIANQCAAALSIDTTPEGYAFAEGFLKAILASDPAPETREMVQKALDAIPATYGEKPKEFGNEFEEEFSSGVEEKSGEAGDAALSVVKSAFEQFQAGVPKMKPVGAESANEYGTGVGSGESAVSSNAQTLVNAAVQVLQSGGDKILSASKTAAQAGAQGVHEAESSFYNSAMQMVNGVVRGISNMQGSVVAAARNMAMSAVAAVNAALQIHSPSVLMIESGEYFDLGLAKGIKDNSKKVETEAEKMSKNVLSAATEWLDSKKAENKITVDSELKFWKDMLEAANLSGDALIEVQEKVNDLTKSLSKDRYEESKKWIDAEKELNRLSAEQELEAWERIAKRRNLDLKEQIQAEKQVADKKSEISKASLAASKKWIEEEKYYDRLSAEEEIAAWERVLDRKNLELEEQLEADKQYYAAQKALQQEQEKALEEQQKKLEQISNEYENSLKSRVDSLNSYAGIFDKIERDTKVTGNELLKNLKDQVKYFKDWQTDMLTLEEKGITGPLLEELNNLGPAAADQIHALSRMTSAQLDEYAKLYEEKANLIAEQAKIDVPIPVELQVEPIDPAKVITEKDQNALKTAIGSVFSAAYTGGFAEKAALFMQTGANSLIQYTEGLVKANPILKDNTEEIMDDSVDQVASYQGAMTSTGYNLMLGVASGVSSGRSAVVNAVAATLAAAVAAARESMKIHSPSQVMAGIGDYMAQGLEVGWTRRMKSVVEEIRDSIPVPEVASPHRSMQTVGEGVVNALSSVMGGYGQSNQPIILQVQLDSKIIAETTFDPLREVERRRGVALG